MAEEDTAMVSAEATAAEEDTVVVVEADTEMETMVLVLELHDMAAVEEVAASLPAVGGRSHLPQHHGRPNYRYTSPFRFSRSLFSSRSSPRFILGPRQLSHFLQNFCPQYLSISLHVFFSNVFQQRVLLQPTDLQRSNVYIQTKVGFLHG